MAPGSITASLRNPLMPFQGHLDREISCYHGPKHYVQHTWVPYRGDQRCTCRLQPMREAMSVLERSSGYLRVYQALLNGTRTYRRWLHNAPVRTHSSLLWVPTQLKPSQCTCRPLHLPFIRGLPDRLLSSQQASPKTQRVLPTAEHRLP
jgi:hypothetical protein